MSAQVWIRPEWYEVGANYGGLVSGWDVASPGRSGKAKNRNTGALCGTPKEVDKVSGKFRSIRSLSCTSAARSLTRRCREAGGGWGGMVSRSLDIPETKTTGGFHAGKQPPKTKAKETQ